MKRWNDPYGILSLKTTTSQEITLLFVLSTFVNGETLEAYPSNSSLCGLTKMHRNTIVKLKKSLVNKKIISIVGKTRHNIDVVKFNICKENGQFLEGVLHTTGASKDDGLAHPECMSCTSGVQSCTSQVQSCTSGGTEHLYNSLYNEDYNKEKIFTIQNKGLSMKGKSIYGKGKSVYDVVKGMKFVTPKKWNVSQLLIAWSNYFAEEFTDITPPLISSAEKNYFSTQAKKIGVDRVGKVIPTIIANWSFFAADMKNEGISYVPAIPTLKFFAKYLAQACDYVDNLDDQAKGDTLVPKKDFKPLNVFCVPIQDNGYVEWTEGNNKFYRKNGSYYRENKDGSTFWYPISKVKSIEEFMNIYNCSILPVDAQEDFI